MGRVARRGRARVDLPWNGFQISSSSALKIWIDTKAKRKDPEYVALPSGDS